MAATSGTSRPSSLAADVEMETSTRGQVERAFCVTRRVACYGRARGGRLWLEDLPAAALSSVTSSASVPA